MKELKHLPKATIDKVRRTPKTVLAYQQYGKSSDIEDYSDSEINEMILGIYKDSKHLLVDGDYFIDLNSVIESVCDLAEVTYFTEPTNLDLKENRHNNIGNIKTFYVRNYFLITTKEVAGTTKHRISKYLVNVGAFIPGRNRFSRFYSISNSYKTLQDFQDGNFPKDLFYPIKSFINRTFFEDHYYISKFRVESSFKIER